MGAFTFIARPIQFNRMQPPDESSTANLAPALFVTETMPIPEPTMRAMPEGIAWSIPAPDDQVLPNRLISGEYLHRLDTAVADTLVSAAAGLAGDSRLVCKRSFDGALTVIIATSSAQALVDRLTRAAPGVGAYFTLNPWDALESAMPTLAEAIESRVFWPVLRKMMDEGEDMSQPRRIRLSFVPRPAGSQGARPADWKGIAREAQDIGFEVNQRDVGVDLVAVTVLSSEEVARCATQIALWIERHSVGFDGWEAENLLKRKSAS